ncbi:unnamed protein product [Closterium sp. NIES-64]|nr:unnamed protein product [Closterium sp. NIES-64]
MRASRKLPLQQTGPRPCRPGCRSVPGGAAAQQGQGAGEVQGEEQGAGQGAVAGGGGGEVPPGDPSVAAEGGRFVRLQPSDGSGGELWGTGASEREGAVWPVQGLGQLLCVAEGVEQPQQQQQPQGKFSVYFYARARECMMDVSVAAGVRPVRAMIVAVPLPPPPATAGSTSSSSMDEGELGRALAAAMSSGEMVVLHQWTVGVPCRNNSFSLSGLLPWRQHGPFSFHLPPSSASAAALSFPPQGVALHLVLLEGSGADSGGTPSGGPVELPVPIDVPVPFPPTLPGGASVTGGASVPGGATVASAAAAVEGGALTSAAAAAGSIDVDLITVAPRGTVASAPPSFSYSPLTSSSPLLTSGSARLLPSSLRLTPLSPPHQAGLALHPTPFPLVSPATPTSPCRPYSFSSSFSFRLSSPHPAALGADGLAFVLLPDPTVGLPGPNMGYGRRPYRQEEMFVELEGGEEQLCEVENGAVTCTTIGGSSGSGATLNSSLPHQHSLAVEFDTSSTRLFSDPTTHHVGINVDYSMTSAGHASVHPAGMASLSGNKNETLHAWVAYNATSSLLSVRLSSSPAMPPSALLSLPFNACDLFHSAPKEDGGEGEAVLVHAGFAGGTGLLPLHTQTHDILSWAFQVDTQAPGPLPVWQQPSLALPFLTPAAPFTASASARPGFSSLQLTPGNQDQETGAAFFPLPLPLLSLLPAPAPRKGKKGGKTDVLVCKARSFTSWFAFELKGKETNGFGVVFMLSTRPGVGQGGAGMGYGRDAQGRNANGTWADGGRSVAVMFDAFSGIDPNYAIYNDVAILSVHTDFNVTRRLAFSSQKRYTSSSLYSMRVDYTAASKTLEAVTYRGATRMGSVKLSLDLCSVFYDGNSTTEGVIPVFAGFSSASTQACVQSIKAWTFRFTGSYERFDVNPCTAWDVNPCGAGRCSAVRSAATGTYTSTCSCPLSQPSYKLPQMPAFQTCFNEFPACRLNSTDTCAPGVCLEGYDASSFCLCPPSFFPLHYSNPLKQPCNQVSESATRVPFFPAPPGLTCPLLLDIFDLSPQELLESNKRMACDKPIPRGWIVNVSASANKSCTSMYTANQGDMCTSINSILDTNITQLNRNIDCSQPLVPGTRICVENSSNTPTFPVAACTDHKALEPGLHTCQQVAAFGYGWSSMGYSETFRINPALYCDHLLPGAAGWGDSVLDSVCLLVDEQQGSGGPQCNTRRFYFVKRGDTCGKLIVSRYRRKMSLFRSLNGGYDCTVSSLWEGMQLCLP